MHPDDDPIQCSYCWAIGHTIHECRHWKRQVQMQELEEDYALERDYRRLEDE